MTPLLTLLVVVPRGLPMATASCAGWSVVEKRSFKLLEAIAGAIGDGVMGAAPRATAVTVRVRKLAVPVDADLDFAQLQLRLERTLPDSPA